jgi:nucleoid DNA-binding protein
MSLDPVQEILGFLERCKNDELLYLPNVGWLEVRNYKPYQGRDHAAGRPIPVPAKRLPMMGFDPELVRAVNGLPLTGATYPNEFMRRYRALHPYENDSEESFVVQRLPSLEGFAADLHAKLAAHETVRVPGLGVFEVVDKNGRPGVNPDTGAAIWVPARKFVRFKSEVALRQRLNGGKNGSPATN